MINLSSVSYKLKSNSYKPDLSIIKTYDLFLAFSDDHGDEPHWQYDGGKFHGR